MSFLKAYWPTWLSDSLLAVLLSLYLCLQAFTVVTVFNAMTFSLKVTPFSVKSLSEASVAMDRFRVELPLPVPPRLQELTLPCGSDGCGNTNALAHVLRS